MKHIDLNCDVGEGLNNENELFPLISSCSIACGGHAGDQKTMNKVIGLALQNEVKIGAHPSYPDRKNFGRLSLNLPKSDFIKSIRSQLTVFSKILREHGGSLNHIKPHGALYNDLAKDKTLSVHFLEAIAPYKDGVKLYVPYGSVIAEEAQKLDWELYYEAFGDRNYEDDLSLVSRKQANALIQEPQRVMEHIMTIINEGKVKTISGQLIPIIAETFCLHGDTPNVLQILMYLSREFPKKNILIK
ncbi:5-oxoprolinase subunit PxpA [Flavobacteriaceae bacterium D16]|nr:5-oxoprolinase subunit PxpA [Flavobacteriaceae bacterium D16]